MNENKADHPNSYFLLKALTDSVAQCTLLVPSATLDTPSLAWLSPIF